MVRIVDEVITIELQPEGTDLRLRIAGMASGNNERVLSHTEAVALTRAVAAVRAGARCRTVILSGDKFPPSRYRTGGKDRPYIDISPWGDSYGMSWAFAADHGGGFTLSASGLFQLDDALQRLVGRVPRVVP